MRRLALIGRRHPVLTALGLAGAGLFGGVEIAVGALIGAGVATAIQRRNGASNIEHEEEQEAQQAQEAEAAPGDTEGESAHPHGLRERAIAAFRAALGDTKLAQHSKQAH